MSPLSPDTYVTVAPQPMGGFRIFVMRCINAADETYAADPSYKGWTSATKEAAIDKARAIGVLYNLEVRL